MGFTGEQDETGEMLESRDPGVVLLPSETESKDCLHLQILRGGISNFKYGILPQRQGKE